MKEGKPPEFKNLTLVMVVTERERVEFIYLLT